MKTFWTILSAVDAAVAVVLLEHRGYVAALYFAVLSGIGLYLVSQYKGRDDENDTF